MSNAQADKVKLICESIVKLADGHEMLDVYAALVYCLGRVIAAGNDPASILCRTIPHLASAAKIECRSLSDLDELEEALNDDHSQSTH